MKRAPPWAIAAVASVLLHLLLAAAVWRPAKPGAGGGGASSRAAAKAPVGSMVRVQVWPKVAPPVPALPPPQPTSVAPERRVQVALIDAGVPSALGAAPGEAEPSSAPAASAGSGSGEGVGSGTGAGDGPPVVDVGSAGSDYASAPAADEVPQALLDAVHAHFARAAAACYPPAARRFRQEAEVTVSLCVGDDGAPEDVEVASDETPPLFREAVTGCVVPQATPLPPSAVGFCFRLPVRFVAP